MKKIISLVLVFLIALLLGSCVKVDTEISIDKNLGVEKKLVQDFSKINAMLEERIQKAKEEAKTNTGITIIDKGDKYVFKHKTEYGESTETIDKVRKPCDNYNETDLKKDKDALKFNSYSCKNIDKNKALLVFKGGSLKDYVNKENGKYILKLNNLNGENRLKKQTLEERKKAAEMYKAYGIEMNFILKFPGEIEKSDIGKIENNKLSFNIYDLLESKNDDPEVIFSISLNNNSSNNNITTTIKDDSNISLKSKGLFYRDMILSKHKLEKSIRGKKYIKKIDLIVDKYSNNQKALKKLYSRLDKLDLTNGKYRKIKDILIYLKSKVGLEIYKNSSNSAANIINFDKYEVKSVNESLDYKMARDSKRISDVSILETALKQFKVDKEEFPVDINSLYSEGYLNKKIKDPLFGKKINGCLFGYKYLPYIKHGKVYEYEIKYCIEKNYKEKITGSYDRGFYEENGMELPKLKIKSTYFINKKNFKNSIGNNIISYKDNYKEFIKYQSSISHGFGEYREERELKELRLYKNIGDYKLVSYSLKGFDDVNVYKIVYINSKGDKYELKIYGEFLRNTENKSNYYFKIINTSYLSHILFEGSKDIDLFKNKYSLIYNFKK